MLKLKEVVGNDVYWTYINKDAVSKIDTGKVMLKSKETDVVTLYLNNGLKINVLNYPDKLIKKHQKKAN